MRSPRDAITIRPVLVRDVAGRQAGVRQREGGAAGAGVRQCGPQPAPVGAATRPGGQRGGVVGVEEAETKNGNGVLEWCV